MDYKVNIITTDECLLKQPLNDTKKGRATFEFPIDKEHNNTIPVLVISGDGKVTDFGELVDEDPLVYASFYGWFSSLQLGWHFNEDFRMIGSHREGARIKFELGSTEFMRFEKKKNDIAAVLQNDVETKNPQRIYRAFRAWLQACIVNLQWGKE